MPPRKKPTELQDLALAVWAGHVGRCIFHAIRIDDSGIVRRRVDLIKAEFCDCIPTIFFDEFTVRVLKMISATADSHGLGSHYLTKHRDIWPEIFVERFTRLEPLLEIRTDVREALWSNCKRFKKLRTLHFDPYILYDLPSDYAASIPIVERYLRDFESAGVLATIVLPDLATDAELLFIAETCPNLEVLDVQSSGGVTSTGIAALKRCSKLRSINLQECNNRQVTCGDVLKLLSTLQRVEHIAVTCQPRGEWDCNGCLKSDAIHQSVKSYHCVKGELTTFDLLALAKKFPNLTRLAIRTTVIENVSVLDRFSNLSSINLRGACFYKHQLNSLLGNIGHNVTELMLPAAANLQWSYLYDIQRHCPNMEVLEFELTQYEQVAAYVLPPFPKLKRFKFEYDYLDGGVDTDLRATLDFPDIRTLEHLECRAFKIAPEKLVAVILDANSFPRLLTITCHSACIHHQTFVANLIQSNNLDLIVTFYS